MGGCPKAGAGRSHAWHLGMSLRPLGHCLTLCMASLCPKILTYPCWQLPCHSRWGVPGLMVWKNAGADWHGAACIFLLRDLPYLFDNDLPPLWRAIVQLCSVHSAKAPGGELLAQLEVILQDDMEAFIAACP